MKKVMYLPSIVLIALITLTANFTQNLRAEILADSETQFSGNQGQDFWLYGYRIVDPGDNLDSYDFVAEFTGFKGGEGFGPWVINQQEWSGTAWDLNTASAAPWTFIGSTNCHPNGTNNGQEHWTIRRLAVGNYLFETTPLAISYHTRKLGNGGNGVTGAIYINGQRVDSQAIGGTDFTGFTRTYYINAQFSTIIDLVLSPRGLDGQPIDGSDNTAQWMKVDTTIPVGARQPNGTVFIPAGAADLDGDGLPDPWEEAYFPGDLTALSNAGDYDGDGLSDSGELNRLTDPTDSDTDNDGLSDNVETDTMVFVDASDTGTDPLRVDTDGDGRTDGDEVNGPIVSNPLLTDTDGDGFSDGSEVATGHDPSDPNNNENTTLIADSVAELSGVQGQGNWFYGYRNLTVDGSGRNSYHPVNHFIPFKGGANMGGWVLGVQEWTGSAWDLQTAASGPWTQLGAGNFVHPNGVNSAPNQEHWAIRRWVANEIAQTTPLALRWHTRKGNANGTGVTGGVYINGQRGDTFALAGNNQVGVIRTYYANLEPGDVVDLVLTPVGSNGDTGDGSDGSEHYLKIDTAIPANPVQPDGTPFIPAGGSDTDADGIPDVWEEIYFPGDLTQLSQNGDYDNDGSTDSREYEQDTNPTDGDSDDDGLSDGPETGTGIFVDASNTGSNPLAVDSDGDGISDANEVFGTPATNPNRADSDGDGFTDPDELAEGTDPNDPSDNILAGVIANSIAEFSGVQGQNGWFNGYRNVTVDGGGINYDFEAHFIAYPGGEGLGPWDGITQTWTGGAWDLQTAGAAPWTFQSSEQIHPNGTNNAEEHWAIRRWVATELEGTTPLGLVWRVRKENLNGTGVSGLLFVNGNLVDSKAIAGNDGTNPKRRFYVNLNKGDVVDLALSPVGLSGDPSDGADGSFTWLWVDTIIERNPRQPDGSLFIPADAEDSDGDGLLDFWELIYVDDLNVLTGAGDNDSDGLDNNEEFAHDANPIAADSDGDGLADGDEVDYGTEPLNPDTDGDGRPDGDEINGFPTSDPTLADTDGDGFNDGSEVATGHNPNDPNNNPNTTKMADSITDWSTTGTQGENNWIYGYRNETVDGGVIYDGGQFIPFLNDGSNIVSPANQWTGSQWDLSVDPPAPWTEIGQESTHPNGDNNVETHWTIRRYVANEIAVETPLALNWRMRKSNLGCGNGVTGLLFVNGTQLDAATIAFNNGTGVSRTYYVNVMPGDIIDLALTPFGTDGTYNDGCDGSFFSLRIDSAIPPNPTQPDGTPFEPVELPNAPPSFTAGPNVMAQEDEGPVTIDPWATGISPGPPNEAGQTVQFLVSNSNPSLFAAQPAISPAGALTFTSAPNACGLATVTVLLRDNGGTEAGGNDTSLPAVFTIQVLCVNDPPTCVPISVSTTENTPVAVVLAAGDVDSEVLGYMIVSAPSSGSLIGVPPILAYSPNPQFSGTDFFDFAVTDGQVLSSICRVTIEVISLNNAPTCHAVVAPLVDFGDGSTRQVVIAGDGVSAEVTLDATQSSDPEGDALSFAWFLGDDLLPFSLDPIAVTILEVGLNEVTLMVSDGQEDCELVLAVEVITPSEAVEELILLINEANLGRKNKQPLLATLKSASAAYERGSVGAGDNMLEALINKLRAQVSPDHPDLADEWIGIINGIIDATPNE